MGHTGKGGNNGMLGKGILGFFTALAAWSREPSLPPAGLRWLLELIKCRGALGATRAAAPEMLENSGRAREWQGTTFICLLWL